MFSHILLLLLSPFAVLMGRLAVDDRAPEILALRQEALIRQRQLGKRPRPVQAERLALLLTCRRMKKQQLLSSLLIVKPDTVVGPSTGRTTTAATGSAQLPFASPPQSEEQAQVVLI